MHESPGWAGLEAHGIRRIEEGVPLGEIRFVEHDRVEPIVALREWWLDEDADAGNGLECLGIALGQSPLVGQEAVQLLELRAAQRSIEIRESIVEADGVVD